MPLVSRTRATLRSAEFGFFGVVVYTRVHTPRRWGEPFSAGVLVFSTLSSRPLRTSWLIVGMGGLDLLPALGRALGVVLCSSCSVVPVLLGFPPAQVVDHRPTPAVGRVALPLGRPFVDGPDTVAPRDSAPPPPTIGREVVPGVRNRTPRRTANGSRPRAPWAQLTTIPAPNQPVQTGFPSRLRALGHTRGGGSSGVTSRSPDLFPAAVSGSGTGSRTGRTVPRRVPAGGAR